MWPDLLPINYTQNQSFYELITLLHEHQYLRFSLSNKIVTGQEIIEKENRISEQLNLNERFKFPDSLKNLYLAFGDELLLDNRFYIRLASCFPIYYNNSNTNELDTNELDTNELNIDYEIVFIEYYDFRHEICYVYTFDKNEMIRRRIYIPNSHYKFIYPRADTPPIYNSIYQLFQQYVEQICRERLIEPITEESIILFNKTQRLLETDWNSWDESRVFPYNLEINWTWDINWMATLIQRCYRRFKSLTRLCTSLKRLHVAYELNLLYPFSMFPGGSFYRNAKNNFEKRAGNP